MVPEPVRRRLRTSPKRHSIFFVWQRICWRHTCSASFSLRKSSIVITSMVAPVRRLTVKLQRYSPHWLERLEELCRAASLVRQQPRSVLDLVAAFALSQPALVRRRRVVPRVLQRRAHTLDVHVLCSNALVRHRQRPRASARTRRAPPPYALAAAQARRHGQRRAWRAQAATPPQAATEAHRCAMAPGPLRERAAHHDANGPLLAASSPQCATPGASPVAPLNSGLTVRPTCRARAKSHYEEDCPCARRSTNFIGKHPRLHDGRAHTCTTRGRAQGADSSRALPFCTFCVPCDAPLRAHRMCIARNDPYQSRGTH